MTDLQAAVETIQHHEETLCPASPDDRHSEAWYGGGECSFCFAPECPCPECSDDDPALADALGEGKGD